MTKMSEAADRDGVFSLLKDMAKMAALRGEPYQRGFDTADLLSNPYPDGSIEARLFVDGWVDGRKWAK